MRLKIRRLLAFGIIVCLMAGAGIAFAGSLHTEVENSSLEAEILLGYDGKITYGKAMPVRVTIRNSGSDLEGTLAVNAYVSRVKYDRFETEIFVPAGGERTVVLPVEAQTRQAVFTVEILRDGEVIFAANASPEGTINPSAMMIGVLSTRPRNLANLDISQENDTLYRYEYWQTVPLTPETLPDGKELLDAFGMIVLDDVDPAALTDKQRQELLDWVMRGHVLILGGGSAAPGNLQLAGDLVPLKAGDFTVSDKVVSALENDLGQKSSGRSPETVLAVLEGEEPLISDGNGNGLVWRNDAGFGRIYTLAWEAGDPVLNAESLLHTFFQQMLLREDAALYNNILYSGGGGGAQNIPGEDTPLNLRNPMPAAAIVIAGSALLACAAWLILRKYGKTQWMWAVLPLLSLAAAGAAVLLAGTSSMNSPVAATAVNLVQDDSGRMTRYTGILAAAPRPGLHSFSVEGEKLDVILYEDMYWEEEEEDAAPREPGTLRVVYRSGARNGIAVNTNTPWQSVRLSAERPDDEAGRVEAEIWMESDGLHGTITNGMPYTLKAGSVICVYGYVKVPALAPGESTDFALISESAKDPLDPVFENGKLYLNSASSFYQVVSQMFYGKNRETYDDGENPQMSLMTAATDYLSDYGSDGQSAPVFVYCAEPEGSFSAPVLADGREAEGRSEIAMLNAEIRYLTVGRTGVVFHAPGMDSAVRCEIDGAGMPAGDLPSEPSQKYAWYDLSERPTFRFQPSDLENVEISRLVVGMEEWYVKEVRCYVLNIRLKTWVEVTPNTPLQRPDQFLDENGNLWCQFRPVAGDTYTSIPAPTLTVEGTLKTN